MKKIIPLAVLLLWVLACSGQQAEPLRIYFVPRTLDTVTPDMILQPSVWKGVPDSAPFVLNVTKGNKLFLKTVFRAVYNDKYLFVRVDAQEPMVDKMNFSGTAPNRDTGAVFRTSHVEFFLDPDLQRKSAGQVVANINGGIYDAIICGGNSDWHYDVSVKAEKRKNGWILAVAFPFKDKGVAVSNVFGMLPHSNPVVGFNACRSASLGGQKATQWSKTPANSYDRPNKYGVLVMSAEKNAISVLQNFLNQKSGSGIMLEGAVKNATEIYRLALNHALAVGDANGRMLPEPRRTQLLNEFKSMRNALKRKVSDAKLAEMLSRCGKLNSEIAEKQRSLSNNILDEI
jgi:hypothetical protein